MIEETYCSFEVSKLLKEKGFDEYCRYFYDCETPNTGYLSNKEYGEYIHNSKVYDGRNLAACPTLQMAMKWLREKHNIYINIQPDFPSSKDYKMCWCWSANILQENSISLKGYQCYIETYEKATEKAIKYCLENLI